MFLVVYLFALFANLISGQREKSPIFARVDLKRNTHTSQ